MNTIAPAVLAGEIHDIISTNWELWDQGSWFYSAEYSVSYESVPVEEWLKELAEPGCGTTACVAGWAVIKTAPKGTKVNESQVFYPDGSSRDVMDAGRDALGLDQRRATWLFSSSRDQDEVLEALASIRDTGTFEIPEYEYDYDDEDYYDDYDV